MARYVETIETAVSPDAAFAYLAELAHFADWDPGVRSSVRVRGEQPALGTAYDVMVNGFGRPMTLRYVVVTFEPPKRLVIAARTRLLRSVDTVTVQERPGGARVTYEATLRLRGPLGVADVVLRPGFRRLAARAGGGLRRVLDRLARA